MIHFKPQLWPTAFMLAALVVLLALGNWQLERRVWKLSLIADIEARTTQAPIDFSQAESLYQQGEDVEYLPAVLEGNFLHDKEIHLFGQSVDGKGGYHIITPLKTADGQVVLVDRGYVPPDKKAPETRASGQISGLVTLEGLVRTDSKPGAFVPPNNPEKGEWFSRDHQTMGAWVGSEPVAPLFLDVADMPVPGGWPRGGQTRIVLKNDHLGYALTWFGLAVVLVGVYLAQQISTGRIRISSDNGG